jgi:hypothetical protein
MPTLRDVRLTADQNALYNCVTDLDSVEQEVNARSKPRGAETKEIPFEFSQSFVFARGDMKVSKHSFKNGAEDLYFSEPCFTVTGVVPAGVAAGPMVPTEVGIGPNPGSSGENTGTFDFFWNYAIGSQGENYATTANDMLWLSRKSLGNRNRWLPLAFRYPLRLKGGDSITFTIKPAFWAFPLSALGDLTSFVVNLTMTGRRNGRMAESQFDPEFRPNYRSDSLKDGIPVLPSFTPRGRR